MSARRIPALALTADAVAVLIFAAAGRISHADGEDVWGLLGTAAPFLVALLAAWALPTVRVDPAGLRAGLWVAAVTAVGGVVLRAAFTGRLPLSFLLVSVVVLVVLALGWRTVSLLAARRAPTGRRVP